MNPINTNLNNLFNIQNIIAIPEYQRNYSWSIEQWHFLVRDVLTAVTATKPRHWLGIILIDKPISINQNGMLLSKNYIIDGQQRLVTLRIWLSALKHHSETINQKISFFNTAEFQVQKADAEDFKIAINNQWTQFSREKLNQGTLGAYYYFRWLLWLGEDAILSESPIIPPKYNSKNKDLLPEQLWEKFILNSSASSHRKIIINRSSPPDIHQLYLTTYEKLYLTFLEIDPLVDEEPSLVFETLNAKRTQLEPFDHVRNRVFMMLKEELNNDAIQVSDFYQNNWQPAEAGIEKFPNKRVKNITAFLYDYLISKGEKKRQEISTKNTASSFEKFLHSKRSSTFSLSDFLEKDFLPAMHFWLIAKGVKMSSLPASSFSFQISNPVIEQLIDSINSLSDGPPVPLILQYLISLHNQAITEQDLIERLKLVEGLFIRQMLAGESFSPNRSKFMQICAHIDQDSTLQKLKDALKPFWPEDKTIINRDLNDPLYDRWKKDLGPLLRGIERALSGQHSNWVRLGSGHGFYSVEHIAPQKLNSAWEKDLKSWRVKDEDFKSRIDSLGNLTIISSSQNSSVKNNAYSQKKKYFSNVGAGAPMKLNDSWLNESKWTDKIIDARTKYLRNIAITYWQL